VILGTPIQAISFAVRWPPLADNRRGARVRLDHGDTAEAMLVPAPDGGASLVFELRDPAALAARYGLTAGEYQTLANIARLATAHDAPNERRPRMAASPDLEDRIHNLGSGADDRP
jgi:hypothetical protein